jgi:hypothetical protein
MNPFANRIVFTELFQGTSDGGEHTGAETTSSSWPEISNFEFPSTAMHCNPAVAAGHQTFTVSKRDKYLKVQKHLDYTYLLCLV